MRRVISVEMLRSLVSDGGWYVSGGCFIWPIETRSFVQAIDFETGRITINAGNCSVKISFEAILSQNPGVVEVYSSDIAEHLRRGNTYNGMWVVIRLVNREIAQDFEQQRRLERSARVRECAERSIPSIHKDRQKVFKNREDRRV